MLFHRDWLKNYICTDCFERAVIREAVPFPDRLRTSLESPHLVVESFVSKALFVERDLFLCGLQALVNRATI